MIHLSRVFLAVLTMLVAVISSGEERPVNVIIYVTDDQGIDSIGAYGNEVIKTPALDSLAKQGMMFTRGYTAASSCSVSRSVLLTGLQSHYTAHYGHSHQRNHFSTFSDIKALPVYLSEAGYRTAQIGKYHLAPETIYHFDEYLDGKDGLPASLLSRSSVEMSDAVLEFINGQSSSEDETAKPFFVYMASSDPHRSGPIVNGQPNTFGNKADGYPGVSSVSYNPADVIVPPFLPDLPGVRAEIAEYYESVSRVDAGIARLMEGLHEKDLIDSTLIIFLSDNGFAMPGAKTTLYDSGARLPLIIKAPGMNATSAVSDALVSWTDITPTVLDYAGVLKDSYTFHGISIKPLLDGKADSVQSEIYMSHNFHAVTMYYPMRVVRTEKYKMVWNIAHALTYPAAADVYKSLTADEIRSMENPKLGERPLSEYMQRPAYELYDMEADPNELNNLAYDSNYSDIAEELLGKIKTFQQETKDPWFYKWSYE